MVKGTHLPITIKEIQAGYLNSPYFKDIYLYLSQNKLPGSKKYYVQNRGIIREIYFIRFITIQIEY